MPIPTTSTLDEQTVGIPTEKPKAAKKKATKKKAAKASTSKKPAAKKAAAKKAAKKKASTKKAANSTPALSGPGTAKKATKKAAKKSTRAKAKPAPVNGPSANNKKPSAKKKTTKKAATPSAAGNLVVEGTLDDAGWHAVLSLTKHCSDVTTGSNQKPSKLVWKKHNASLVIDGDKFKLSVPRKEAAKIPGDFSWFENYHSKNSK